MSIYNLSYILTTYNKIEYLKITLPVLIDSLKADEEIVITDGGSTDGTREYLDELYKANKIQQYISMPDKGESHGINKAMLMARGLLVKTITDDDAFHYAAIAKCKDFMLKHSEIDVLGFDGYGYSLANEVPYFERRDNVDLYKQWKNNGTPFLFSGLSLLIRRSSISLVGLFNTNVKIVDFEYTIRITSGKGKLAWYSGCYYVNIANADSNSVKFWKLCNIEIERTKYMYQGILPLIRFEHIDAVKELFRPLKRLFKGPIKIANNVPYATAYNIALQKLIDAKDEGEFLF